MIDSVLGKVLKETLAEGWANPQTDEAKALDFVNTVRAKLSRLHPAEMAVLLLEIQAAKEVRYRTPHPDYYWTLRKMCRREGVPKQKHSPRLFKRHGAYVLWFKKELKRLRNIYT